MVGVRVGTSVGVGVIVGGGWTTAAADDCCDTDASAFPGQTAYFGMPRACGGYDYDCNGTDERLLPYRASLCVWASLACDGADNPPAFDVDVACGVSSSRWVVNCVSNFPTSMTCNRIYDTMSHQQTCR